MGRGCAGERDLGINHMELGGKCDNIEYTKRTLEEELVELKDKQRTASSTAVQLQGALRSYPCFLVSCANSFSHHTDLIICICLCLLAPCSHLQGQGHGL